ncbi:FG-GAP repeat domain-containing protein [Streptomyces hydrogenans]|uniref:FG-GAP repeat domain-containing protein n=1 Tax=Streptomyces hydrogenans TaxID=1873719 RepID=UPI00382AD49D
MRTAFSLRGRRLAACTALALSVGMLLASPAVAEPAPRPSVEQPRRAAAPLPQLDLSALRDGATARTAQAAEALPPRFDVDGDGATDVLYRDWSGGLGVVMSGPTEGGPWTASGSPEVPMDLVPLGDQTGDGQPEVLVLTQYGKAELHGGATTTSSSWYWSGGGWNVYNKVFSPGDVDGDGRFDVLARQHNGDLYFYRSTGNPTAPFAARVKAGSGWGGFDQLVGIGDNDGDGKGDAVARTPGGDLYFYGSTGVRTNPFKPKKLIGGGWNTYNQLFAADDVNGDGRAELYARSLDGALWGYEGRGNGTYAPRQRLSAAGAYQSGDQFGASGAIPSAGKNALMARTAGGTLYWYGGLNNGKLTPRDQVGSEGGWAGAPMGFASTLDADVFGELYFTVDGDFYAKGSVVSGGWGSYNRIFGPGDLNGDGKGDLLARDRSGVLYLLRGNGQATGFASRLEVGRGWGSYNRLIGAGDISGDGRADILARDGAGVLWLYKGTGVSTHPFHTRVKVGSGWGAYRQIAAPGDLDGDGRADLVATTSGGTLYRYHSTATAGVFAPRAKVGDGWQVYPDLY